MKVRVSSIFHSTDGCGGRSWEFLAMLGDTTLLFEGSNMTLREAEGLLWRLSKKYYDLAHVQPTPEAPWFIFSTDDDAWAWYDKNGWLAPDEPRFTRVFGAWGPIITPWRKICVLRKTLYIRTTESIPSEVAFEIMSAIVRRELDGKRRAKG